MKQKIYAFLLVLGMLMLLPVRALAAGLLVPGGQLIALELRNDTVTVAAFDEVLGEQARSAGLRTGDVIEKIDGKAVSSAADVKEALETCGESWLWK